MTARVTWWREAGRVVGPALAAAALGACELADTTAPELEPRAVVHAVLNPSASVQTVIVERTLRSARYTSGPDGAGREPIADARVVIYDARNDSVVGARSVDDGVYWVASVTVTDGPGGPVPPNVLRLRPGERYRLRVETPLGTVRGETTIPTAAAAAPPRRTFNVDRDTLRLAGRPPAPGYLLRHESRVGVPNERLATRLDTVLVFPPAQAAAGAEPPWAFAFARAFMRPGLSETFTVIALDSNYVRYYIGGVDPFGDETRGNTLSGGVGLFGSVAPVLSQTLDLIADIDSPIEGTWVAGPGARGLPVELTLYVSPFFPGGGGGSAIRPAGRAHSAAGRVLEVNAFMDGNRLSLAFIDPTDGWETGLATGVLGADTLELIDRFSGERVTYRRR